MSFDISCVIVAYGIARPIGTSLNERMAKDPHLTGHSF